MNQAQSYLSSLAQEAQNATYGIRHSVDTWLSNEEDNTAARSQWEDAKDKLAQNGLDLSGGQIDQTYEKILDAEDSNEVVDILFNTIGQALNSATEESSAEAGEQESSMWNYFSTGL